MASGQHSELVNRLLLRLGAHPRVRVFKRTTGFGLTVDGRPIKFGIPGGADIHGWLMGGRALEVEAKVGRDTLRDGQPAFRATAERFGVLYIEAHAASKSDADLDAAVERAYAAVEHALPPDARPR